MLPSIDLPDLSTPKTDLDLRFAICLQRQQVRLQEKEKQASVCNFVRSFFLVEFVQSRITLDCIVVGYLAIIGIGLGLGFFFLFILFFNYYFLSPYYWCEVFTGFADN